MAERSVHEAAVEAMAATRCNRVGHFVVVEQPPCGWCRDVARSMIAALVASAEVREGPVRCLRWGDTGLPCDYRAGTRSDHPELGTAVHPACFLAALGGTEAT